METVGTSVSYGVRLDHRSIDRDPEPPTELSHQRYRNLVYSADFKRMDRQQLRRLVIQEYPQALDTL